jgi:hypothetical protein
LKKGVTCGICHNAGLLKGFELLIWGDIHSHQTEKRLRFGCCITTLKLAYV